METVSISNEQTLKSGIKDLVIAAMAAGAHGMAQLKNCMLHDNQNNQVEFEIAVSLKKVTDADGNTVFLNPVTVAEKRQQFAKDLNKLISGEYVLIPKNDLNKGQ